MTHIEKSIFNNNPRTKPTIYCRYVDDCFIIIDNSDSLLQLKEQFKSSDLKFTYEIGNNKLNFLDAHINHNPSSNNYLTSVYQKPKNTGTYLNFKSECPQRCKDATVTALIHRTYKISSNWSIFDTTVNKIKQTFVNNGYHNKLFDSSCTNMLTTVPYKKKLPKNLLPTKYTTSTSSPWHTKWTNAS